MIGILVNQSDRFAKAMYGSNHIDSGRSIMFAYIAISIGDILVMAISFVAFYNKEETYHKDLNYIEQ